MKFFKYLIFIILSIISFSTFSATVRYYYISDGKKPNVDFDTQEQACQAALSATESYISVSSKNIDGGYCNFKNSGGSTSQYLIRSRLVENKCQSGQKKFLDGYIGKPDSFAPSTVCFQGCTYNSDGGGTAFDTPNGNISWGINAETTGSTCPTDTPKGEDTPNNDMKPEECKNANGSNAYCDKPSNKNCPTGYKQGMFNNKQICIKNSNDPDPNKPNPNDPNNGNGNGEGNCNGTNNCNTSNFDDSGIIAAINSMKSSLSSAISSLSSAISSMSSSLSSAINANGDKVTNAVNTNGKNTVDALNKGTEATKENEGKLDGIKNGVKEGNGLLKEIGKTLSDIKDFITGEPELGVLPDPTPPNDQGIFDKKFNAVFSFSKSCPPDIPFNYDTQFLKGNFSISLNWLCIFFTFIAYPLQLLSHFIGLWILYETVNRKEIKW